MNSSNAAREPASALWNRPSLVTKIAVVLVAMLLAQLVAAWLVWQNLDGIQEQEAQVASATADVKAMREIRLDIESLQSASLAYLVTGDQRWGDLARSTAQRLEARITATIANPNTDDQSMTLMRRVRQWITDSVEPALSGEAGQRPSKRDLRTREADLTDSTFNDEVAQPLTDHLDSGKVEQRDTTLAHLNRDISRAQLTLIAASALAATVGAFLLALLGSSLARRFATLNRAARSVQLGDLASEVPIDGRDELGLLAENLEGMRQALLDRQSTDDREAAYQNSMLEIAHHFQSSDDDHSLLRLIVSYVGASAGALYTLTAEDSRVLRLLASTGLEHGVEMAIRTGEGLAGGVVESQTPLFSSAPVGYAPISSALGAASPQMLAIVPAVQGGTTVGLIELVSLGDFVGDPERFLPEVAEMLSLHLAVRAARERTEELLEESRAQAEELEAQSTELEVSNAELAANTVHLEEQQNELQAAHGELARRAKLVDQASASKTTFLANMSHELRTPLNSIMILSDRLAGNADGTLTQKDVELAGTINDCGQDLLRLVNDALDLSKVEAGHLEIRHDEMTVADLMTALDRQFRPIAEERGLALAISAEPNVPVAFRSDQLRVEQVLRNLLSNACKFTREGSVSLAVSFADDELVFAVTDTGAGIDATDQAAIFEPFAQADSSRSRAARGTGLGLAIARELAQRLGGALTVHSTLGVGSTFKLALPLKAAGGPPAGSPPHQVADESVGEGDSSALTAPTSDDRVGVLLVVEDDPVFAGLISEVARRQGFEPLVAHSGEHAFALIDQRTPDAITLDLGLPDVDGWVLLDRLRADHRTRYTPIQIISGSESAMSVRGVQGKLLKPASPQDLTAAVASLLTLTQDHPHRLAIVGGDHPATAGLTDLLAMHPDIEVVRVDNPSQLDGVFDVVVVDHVDPAAQGRAVDNLRAATPTAHVPLILVCADPGTLQRGLLQLVTTVVQADNNAAAHVMAEINRFLGAVGVATSDQQPRAIEERYESGRGLVGKVILVADDDPRNVFALATILEPLGVEMLDAANGQTVLTILRERDDIDLVLMDVTMPLMDGLEATRRLRSDERTAEIPIIAVTALAMPEDMQRCLDAGVNDYVTKPVDVDQLIGLIKVWLNA
jgi:signal transduction histidine kinase/CheY-like chemotaxis protein/HAMP domain-containing protein